MLGWPEKSEYDDKITPPGQRQEGEVAGSGTWRASGKTGYRKCQKYIQKVFMIIISIIQSQQKKVLQ